MPWLCRGLGHAGRVIGNEFSAALPAAHVERGTRAASGTRTPALARLNVAQQVCGEARPVRLDFWRSWSQPRHQPLPARCCWLRRGRAWRQVMAPSHGAARPRPGAGTAHGIGDVGPGSMICAITVPFLGGQCPMVLGKEQPLHSWRVPPQPVGSCSISVHIDGGTRTSHPHSPSSPPKALLEVCHPARPGSTAGCRARGPCVGCGCCASAGSWGAPRRWQGAGDHT